MDSELLELVKNYQTPDSAKDLLHKAKIVFIVGISGAGKDTILKELLKTDKYKLIISHTTRQPRVNHGELERDGQDYHFIDQEKAKEMLKAREFIEAKQYSGNVYGTSVAEVSKAYDEGKIGISDIEVQGVAEYMALALNVTPIFILPPNFETWQTRLQSRYSGEPDAEDLKKRMDTAKQELEEALNKDYFEFVINDDLARTVQAVDEVAHGSLSTKKNAEARDTAQQLFEKID